MWLRATLERSAPTDRGGRAVRGASSPGRMGDHRTAGLCLNSATARAIRSSTARTTPSLVPSFAIPARALSPVHPLEEVAEHDRSEVVLVRGERLLAVITTIPPVTPTMLTPLRGRSGGRRRRAPSRERCIDDRLPAGVVEALELGEAPLGRIEDVVRILLYAPIRRRREECSWTYVKPRASGGTGPRSVSITTGVVPDRRDHYHVSGYLAPPRSTNEQRQQSLFGISPARLESRLRLESFAPRMSAYRPGCRRVEASSAHLATPPRSPKAPRGRWDTLLAAPRRS